LGEVQVASIIANSQNIVNITLKARVEVDSGSIAGAAIDSRGADDWC